MQQDARMKHAVLSFNAHLMVAFLDIPLKIPKGQTGFELQQSHKLLLRMHTHPVDVSFLFFTFQRLTDLELTVKLLLRMRANNDGGGRRRGGQWFGWFASCRSRQLRLNGNNGLTRTNLESQTRQIATALCLTGSLISLLVKYSHRFFSKSKQKKQQLKKELKCWVWIWNQTKRRVSFSPHVLLHIQ